MCKAGEPEKAAGYDAALAAWKSKNKDAIARGEAVEREHARLDGVDFDGAMGAERDSETQQLKASSKPDLQQHCAHLLEITSP